MKFETFLNMLPKIALMMNYEECEDIREMVELLINNHFVPLYELIMEDTFFGSLKTMVESETEFEEVEQIYGVKNPKTKIKFKPIIMLLSKKITFNLIAHLNQSQ